MTPVNDKNNTGAGSQGNGPRAATPSEGIGEDSRLRGIRADSRSILITGAGGYIGRQLVAWLARDVSRFDRIVATDVRLPAPEARAPGIVFVEADVRDPRLADLLREHAIDTVVHLAAIVTPVAGMPPDFEYSVDVLGTRNVLECCVAAGVRKFLYTSSGAAYGYYEDNPPLLVETDRIRGNDAFSYSRHKRLVEEMLAGWRVEHPELKQLILRPGTILGESVSNQITAMFERPFVLGIRGSDSPFVFIWDHDVVGCLVRGLEEDRDGIYNLAGDGVVTMPEVARRLGKPYVAVPACMLRGALAVLHPLGISPYGPEQVDFLRYRPVLSNARLKSEFGYIPEKTSDEVFDLYMRSHGHRP